MMREKLIKFQDFMTSFLNSDVKKNKKFLASSECSLLHLELLIELFLNYPKKCTGRLKSAVKFFKKSKNVRTISERIVRKKLIANNKAIKAVMAYMYKIFLRAAITRGFDQPTSEED